MLACCERTVSEARDALLADTPENPVMRAAILQVCELYAPFARAWIDSGLAVARLKAGEAGRECPMKCACGKRYSVIIVADTFLFLLWRIQMILISMVESWVVDDNAVTKVKWNQPGSFQRQQLRVAVETYLGGVPVSPAGLSDLVGACELSKAAEAKRILLQAAGLGELWVVLHEVCHSVLRVAELQGDRANLTFKAMRLTAEVEMNNLDLGLRTHKLWVEEVAADLLAVDLLMTGMTQMYQARGMTRDAAGGYSAWLLLGGVRAALEAMTLVERSIPVSLRPNHLVAEHPTNQLRYECILRHVGGRRFELPVHPPVNTLCDAIGELSFALRSAV